MAHRASKKGTRCTLVPIFAKYLPISKMLSLYRKFVIKYFKDPTADPHLNHVAALPCKI